VRGKPADVPPFEQARSKLGRDCLLLERKFEHRAPKPLPQQLFGHQRQGYECAVWKKYRVGGEHVQARIEVDKVPESSAPTRPARASRPVPTRHTLRAAAVPDQTDMRDPSEGMMLCASPIGNVGIVRPNMPAGSGARKLDHLTRRRYCARCHREAEPEAVITYKIGVDPHFNIEGLPAWHIIRSIVTQSFIGSSKSESRRIFTPSTRTLDTHV
jgi:hypothetical protein